MRGHHDHDMVAIGLSGLRTSVTVSSALRMYTTAVRIREFQPLWNVKLVLPRIFWTSLHSPSFAWPTSNVQLRLLVPEGLLVCVGLVPSVDTQQATFEIFLSNTSLPTARGRVLGSSGPRTIVWCSQNSYTYPLDKRIPFRF